MGSTFAFVVIKGPSLIKIISARNQDIIMVYEAVIKVDIYGKSPASERTPHASHSNHPECSVGRGVLEIVGTTVSLLDDFRQEFS
jgi:hypothetical protein